jgi:hypothetical protein
MVSSNPLEVANQFLGGPDRSLLRIYEPEALKAYYKLFDNPAIVHAMCEYRAGGTIGLVDASADVAAGRQVKCPILVLCGRGGMVGRTYDAIEEWKAVSETGDVRGEPVDCSIILLKMHPNFSRGISEGSSIRNACLLAQFPTQNNVPRRGYGVSSRDVWRSFDIRTL